MQCLAYVSFALTEGWLTVIDYVLYYLVAGIIAAVILRAVESFYIDEAVNLTMDVIAWPVAVICYLKGKRDKAASDSDTE